MALINCPECNKQISDKASSCPHCGYPMNNTAHDGNEFKTGDSATSKNSHSKDDYIVKEVKRLIANGDVIAAVKYYKDATNCNLKEAKDKIDSLRGVTPSSGNKGCASVIIILLSIIGTLLFIFK